MLVAMTGGDGTGVVEQARRMAGREIEGIALVGLDASHELRALLDERRIPYVAIDAGDGASPTASVQGDYRTAGETVARVQRNRSNASPQYRRLSIVFVPNAAGAPPLLRAGEWSHAAVPDSIPVWLTAIPGAFVGTVAPPTCRTQPGPRPSHRSARAHLPRPTSEPTRSRPDRRD